LDSPSSIPGSARFLSSPQRSDRLCGPPGLITNGYCRLFPRGVKRQRHEADQSPPSSAEVKKGGATQPLLLYVLMAKYLTNYSQAQLLALVVFHEVILESGDVVPNGYILVFFYFELCSP
jgi:hypothetical protein